MRLYHYPESLDDRRYLIGTTMAIMLGVAAMGASMGISSSANKAAGKSANKQAEAATEAARKTAEQRSLMEMQNEGAATATRRSLLDVPTSGFGPNTNLARSFLTTL